MKATFTRHADGTYTARHPNGRMIASGLTANEAILLMQRMAQRGIGHETIHESK